MGVYEKYYVLVIQGDNFSNLVVNNIYYCFKLFSWCSNKFQSDSIIRRKTLVCSMGLLQHANLLFL